MSVGRKHVAGSLRADRKGKDAPQPPDALPRCPDHLSHAAKKEWRRLATPLWRMGVLTVADRAALAAYCQAWGRWVEAEEKIAGTPPLIKSPSGHVQQSPWISIANKQLELMARYMRELGLTPAARMKLAVPGGGDAHPPGPVVIRLVDRFGETSGEHRLGDPLPEGDDETSRRIRTIDNI